MESYYYTQLSKHHQSIYSAMKTGLTALAPTFTVPRAEGRDLADLFFKLRLDHPEIFYAVSYQYRYYKESNHVTLIPEYLFDKNKVKEHQKAMEARVAKLIRPAQSMPDREKEQYIHDFICTNVRYDKLKKPYSHEIIGPLGQGVGVCEGIAKTVKILCDALGLWCMIAVSDANAEKKIKYRHAWNVIKIGGSYYHLDATFDNTLGRGEALRYDYFNLEDRQIFRDHEPVLYPVPVCNDGDHYYYNEKKLSFTKTEDVEKRALQAIKKGKLLIFHWRAGYLTRELLTVLLELLEQTASQKGKYAKIRLNWPQAVLQVSFTGDTDHVLQEEVTMEQANEGEAL